MNEAIRLMNEVDIDDLDAPSALLETAMILAIVYVCAVGIPTGIIMVMVIKCRRHRVMKWLPAATLFVEVGLSLTCMILSFLAVDEYDNREKNIKKLDDAVDGCMDQYSDIPDDVMKK